jgi:hypothetical protein
MIELHTTTSTTPFNDTLDGGDVDIDDKIHEAYDLDAMRAGSQKRDSASASSSFKGTTRRDGHQRLGSHADDSFEPRAGSVATTEAVEDAGITTAGDGGEGDGIVYKVYKRRWFGLVQLTLLNIVVSWDVSFSDFSHHSRRSNYRP